MSSIGEDVKALIEKELDTSDLQDIKDEKEEVKAKTEIDKTSLCKGTRNYLKEGFFPDYLAKPMRALNLKEEDEIILSTILLHFLRGTYQYNYINSKNIQDTITLEEVEEAHSDNKLAFLPLATSIPLSMTVRGPKPKAPPVLSAAAETQAATVSGGQGAQKFNTVYDTTQYDSSLTKVFDVHLKVFEGLHYSKEERELMVTELLGVMHPDKPRKLAFNETELYRQMRNRNKNRVVQMQTLFNNNEHLKSLYEALKFYFGDDQSVLFILSYAAEDIRQNNFVVRLAPNAFEEGRLISKAETDEVYNITLTAVEGKTIAFLPKERSAQVEQYLAIHPKRQAQQNAWFYIPYQEDKSGKWCMLTPNHAVYHVEVENQDPKLKAEINSFSIDDKRIKPGYNFLLEKMDLVPFEGFIDVATNKVDRFKTATADSDEVQEQKYDVETRKLGVMHLELVPEKPYVPKPSVPTIKASPSSESWQEMRRVMGPVVQKCIDTHDNLLKRLVAITHQLTKEGDIKKEAKLNDALATLTNTLTTKPDPNHEDKKTWSQQAVLFLDKQKAHRAQWVSDFKPIIKSWVSESKHGIHWPHDPDVRRKFLENGWEFAPTVLRRDRNECRTCKAEESHYLPYKDLRKNHKKDCAWGKR